MSRSDTTSIHIIIDSLLHIITQNQCPGPIFFTRPKLFDQAQSSVRTFYYTILLLHSCIIITALLRIMAYYTFVITSLLHISMYYYMVMTRDQGGLKFSRSQLQQRINPRYHAIHAPSVYFRSQHTLISSSSKCSLVLTSMISSY
jgi:hypothetical protein